MSVKQGGKTIAGATQYHPDLFDFKWADHILDDAQWLMANPFSWQYGSMYQAAYANLSDAITGKTLQSETVAGIAVQFYLADDGHKICPASEESNVLAIYNKTGNAWYYIIDTTNQRFKLPRRHSQQIVRSVKNADGSWYRLYADGWVEQGGLCSGTEENNPVTMPIEMSNTEYQVLAIADPTDSVNSWGWIAIARNTKTTTGFSLGCRYGSGVELPLRTHWQVSGQSAIDISSFQDGEKYLYFYVGAFTQTAIENTAGLNTELFNGKADIDLSNISVAGQQVITKLVMPDWSAGVDITIPVQATPYVCPFDGVYCVCFLPNQTISNLYVNGVETANCMHNSTTANANKTSISVFLAKGDSIYFSGAVSAAYTSTFYPLKGV